MYRVEITNEGAFKFNVRAKDYEFVIDVNGKGVTPPDALLASIGSCIGVYLRKYFSGAKLPLDGFKITVEGDLGKEPPYYFRRIDVAVDIKDVELDERMMAAVIEFIKNCPVHNTLKNNPAINVALIP